MTADVGLIQDAAGYETLQVRARTETVVFKLKISKGPWARGPFRKLFQPCGVRNVCCCIGFWRFMEEAYAINVISPGFLGLELNKQQLYVFTDHSGKLVVHSLSGPRTVQFNLGLGIAAALSS